MHLTSELPLAPPARPAPPTADGLARGAFGARSVLELRGLSCVRGERMLFSGLAAGVQPGQLLRVQGPNGSGKSTLLRTICGLLSPDEGEVLWRGRPVAVQREAFHRELVYLGHAPGLKGGLSAVENLMATCGVAGIRCTDEDAALALLHAGLRDVEWLPARMLSQGQRRRVALAQLALATRRAGGGSLWVLDEPYNALDDAAIEWLSGLIEGHLARGGIGVLTSHQPVALDDGITQVVIEL